MTLLKCSRARILATVSLLAFAVFMATGGSAQERTGASQVSTNGPSTPAPSRYIPSPTPTPSQRPNGISVGRPKVFDNRTLTLMLESLSNSLQNMQFVNRDSLAAAFAFLQGSRSSDVTSNFSFTTSPIPSLHQEDTTNTGLVNSAGSSLPDTNTLKIVTDRAAINPQAPALDAASGFPAGFSPTFGQNPGDLLSDQVNLTYQIFNLRMILERSLSDRLLGDKPRRQAVLGFNVTLDPPRTANDAVAVVEVTLSADACAGRKDDCLSLVSLMPQEKTYNAAAVSNKSRAFGGSAVVNMFQIGYNERRRSQVFYLYRDNDTISYERMDPESGKIIFGWMFRPVLGRRSVSPGLRQMFAILALPSDDELELQESASKGVSTKMDATVRTYWKKYDGNTMTSFEEGDTNRGGRIKNALTFGLTKPEIFAEKYKNGATYRNIEVHPTDDYQSHLRPQLQGLSWRLIGPKTVIISAVGNNFFTGTQVSIGDKTYTTTADGLNLKSNQSFDLVTSLDAIVNGTGSIIGRYGTAVPLLADYPKQNGLTIRSIERDPSFAGISRFRIFLANQQVPNPADPAHASLVPEPLEYPDEHKYGKPVVTVNGNLVMSRYDVDLGAGIIGVNVPDSFLTKGEGVVKVSFPFLSDRWTASFVVSDVARDFEITRLGANSIIIRTKDQRGFLQDPQGVPPDFKPTADLCWRVIAGDREPIALKTGVCPLPTDAGNEKAKTKAGAKKPRPSGTKTKQPDDSAPTTLPLSSHALLFNLGSEVPDKIVLVTPLGVGYQLDVPKLTQPPPASPKAITLNQYDALWIDVPVKDVSKPFLVEANNLTVKFRIPPPDADGNQPKLIQVEITRELTAQPGTVELTVLDKDGKIILGTRLQILATGRKERKQ